MLQAHLGEFSALLTAIFWVISGVFFEKASKRTSSLAVAYLRMIFAFILISLLLWVMRGKPLPTDATPSAWLWLSLSGLVGFVIGDIFLFEAYVRIGARISLLLMSFSPVITGLLSYFIFGEVLQPLAIVGIVLTLAGIAVVVLTKGDHNNLKLRVDSYGVLCGVMGAVGQSVGTILSKQGMGNYDAFAATQIRIIASILGFTLFFIIGKHWQKLATLLKDTHASLQTAAGAMFGTTLGVGFSLLAIQHTQAAVAAAIMSIMPVLIIPVNWLVLKEKIKWIEMLGALVTVVGVILLYLKP
jgi:drug/metabolite transporter (DMT)-like permease